MFESRFMPCHHCGESLDRAALDPHECTPERLADFQMFALREEMAGFEAGYLAYVDSPHGVFDVWLAAQQVRGRRV